MKKLLVFAVLSAVMVMTSCATIIDPGPDKINVTSDPEGATVIYNGEKVGETPTIVEVDRSGTAVLTFEKDEYYPVTVVPPKVINGWSYLGGIFMLVDEILDNANKYSEKPMKVTLTQK